MTRWIVLLVALVSLGLYVFLGGCVTASAPPSQLIWAYAAAHTNGRTGMFYAPTRNDCEVLRRTETSPTITTQPCRAAVTGSGDQYWAFSLGSGIGAALPGPALCDYARLAFPMFNPSRCAPIALRFIDP